MKHLIIALCLALSWTGMSFGGGLKCLLVGSLTDASTIQGIDGIMVEVHGCGAVGYSFTNLGNGSWDCYMIQCSRYYVTYKMDDECYHPLGATMVPNPRSDLILGVPATMVYPIDSDGDKLCNINDNCPYAKNANGYGTCVKGKVGNTCFTSLHCGCGGRCSADQEDSDGNGIGDACDGLLAGKYYTSVINNKPYVGIINERDIGYDEGGMIENEREIGVITDGLEIPPLKCPFMD